MYYLAADPGDLVFTNNLKVCKGVFTSPSLLRVMDENLKNAVSIYEITHLDREKEAVFEKIRSAHYPYRPSRMGGIYLFQDYETAVNANERWWGNKRNFYEAKIRNGSVFMVADSEWLICTPQDYEENANNYFQEKTTNRPVIEIVVMGVVEVSPEPSNT